MADTVQPPRTVATPVAPNNTNGSFFSQHKGLVIGGTLVLAAGAVLLYEHFKKSSTSTTTSPQVITTGPPTTTTSATAYQQLSTQIGSGFNNLQTMFESFINSRTGSTTTATRTPIITPRGQLLQTASTTGPGSYQKAPTYNTFSVGGTAYTPVTLFKQKSGTVYFKTTATGKPIPMSITQAKSIEHTGTRHYPQYTTYEKVS